MNACNRVISGISQYFIYECEPRRSLFYEFIEF
jgi:hypothetical protein